MPYTTLKLWLVQNGTIDEISVRTLRKLLKKPLNPMEEVLVFSSYKDGASELALEYDKGLRFCVDVTWGGETFKALLPAHIPPPKGK